MKINHNHNDLQTTSVHEKNSNNNVQENLLAVVDRC